MRLPAALCLAVAIVGCAGGGRTRVPAVPETPGTGRPATPGTPAETPGTTTTTGAPGEAAVQAGCLRAARLAAEEEHKPAVDALAALPEGGGRCGRSVLDAVAESARRLAEADALVRGGLEQRRAGDLEAARRAYREALVVYPKYYWVDRLIANLPPDPSGELEALRREAATRLDAGQPQAALQALERAAQLAPESDLAAEATRLRTEIGDASLAQAQRAQQVGDLDLAVELATRAISVRPEAPVRDRAVDLARQLGLALYSAGELVRAEAIWRAALALDAGNELLLQYLDEVASRLQSLDQIKKGSGG